MTLFNQRLREELEEIQNSEETRKAAHQYRTSYGTYRVKVSQKEH